MLKSVKILQKHASLDTYFHWEKIPKLAVITGLNGSGKTKLIELIHSTIQKGHPSNRANRNSEPIVNISFSQGLERYSVSKLIRSEDSANFSTNSTEKKQTYQSIVTGYIHRVRRKTGALHLEEFSEVDSIIEQKTGKPVQELTNEEIKVNFPYYYPLLRREAISHSFIEELFDAFQKQKNFLITEAVRQTFSTEEEINFFIIKTLSVPPWEELNQTLNNFGFPHNITIPEDGLDYSAGFFEKANPANAIRYEELSTGEKVLVSLVLWSYNHELGKHIKLLFLDEFDAHLNPALSSILLKIVKEKLVGEYGIQVIMTTHSPSTVAYVDDEHLFWMERGENIRPSSKSEIIPIISDGIMTFQEGVGLLEAIVSNRKNMIIFTEGETDIMHIKTAIKKLKIDDTAFEFFSTKDENSGGAPKLVSFLANLPSILCSKNKVVGIIDPDRLDLLKNFTREGEFYVSKGNKNVFLIVLPVQKGNCIEYLYSREVLQKYGCLNGDGSLKKKSKVKRTFAEKVKHLDEIEFLNFHPLFDLIEKLSAITSPPAKEVPAGEELVA